MKRFLKKIGYVFTVFMLSLDCYVYSNDPLKLMTWNVCHEKSMQENKILQVSVEDVYNYKLTKIAKTINDIYPDVVCLQEVSENIAKGLQEALTSYLFYRFPSKSSESGLCIGCKVKSDFIMDKDSYISVSTASKGRSRDLCGLCVILEKSKKRKYIVGSIHFSKDISDTSEYIAKQYFQFVVNKISGFDSSYPVILAGDFNTKTNVMSKLVEEKKWNLFDYKSFTYLSSDGNNFASIDHVVYSNQLSLLKGMVYPLFHSSSNQDQQTISNAFKELSSDHLPVVVTLTWAQEDLAGIVTQDIASRLRPEQKATMKGIQDRINQQLDIFKQFIQDGKSLLTGSDIERLNKLQELLLRLRINLDVAIIDDLFLAELLSICQRIEESVFRSSGSSVYRPSTDSSSAVGRVSVSDAPEFDSFSPRSSFRTKSRASGAAASRSADLSVGDSNSSFTRSLVERPGSASPFARSTGRRVPQIASSLSISSDDDDDSGKDSAQIPVAKNRFTLLSAKTKR